MRPGQRQGLPAQQVVASGVSRCRALRPHAHLIELQVALHIHRQGRRIPRAAEHGLDLPLQAQIGLGHRHWQRVTGVRQQPGQWQPVDAELAGGLEGGQADPALPLDLPWRRCCWVCGRWRGAAVRRQGRARRQTLAEAGADLQARGQGRAAGRWWRPAQVLQAALQAVQPQVQRAAGQMVHPMHLASVPSQVIQAQLPARRAVGRGCGAVGGCQPAGCVDLSLGVAGQPQPGLTQLQAIDDQGLLQQVGFCPLHHGRAQRCPG